MIDITEPSFTRRLHPAELPNASINLLFYGGDIEEDRADTIVGVLGDRSETLLCRLTELDDASYSATGLDVTFNLFESSQLAALVDSVDGTVAIDLTSLEHRVWAPLMKAFVSSAVRVVALYAEPDDYRRSDDLPGSVYDLSTSRGIDPLPGFARLARRAQDAGDFAPLLGFEGARLGHLFDQEEVEVRRTAPIVGFPGFRPEYPMYTFLENRDMLELGRMFSRVEYARASCPFEAFMAIEKIHTKTGFNHLRVAPIGTKPHALGAVLYAIRNPTTVELIYDNPVRSRGRTRGSRGVYLYEVSDFLEWLPS